MTTYADFCTAFHAHFTNDANARVVMGIDVRLGELPDPSLAGLDAAVADARQLLASLADIDTARLSFDEKLDLDLARLALEAEIVTADAASLDRPPFDAVLLDAPCSATGTIRRHPDVAWTKLPEDRDKLSALQARLLDAAAKLTKPGGRLVYCTCSLEPEEGERQVQAFLEREPGFRREPIRAEEIGGLAEAIDGHGDLRTLPHQIPGATPRLSGWAGFYASRLVRV